MAKDFDALRRARALQDREFTLGGETFQLKNGVRPEVLLAWEDVSEDTPASKVLEIIDELVEAMMDGRDGAYERYLAIRSKEDDPLTLEDLTALIEWMIEVQTGRTPTQPPSPSISSPEATGTTSTDDSSSPDEPEAPTA